jgi:hypothetical protein
MDFAGRKAGLGGPSRCETPEGGFDLGVCRKFAAPVAKHGERNGNQTQQKLFHIRSHPKQIVSLVHYCH